VCQTHASFGESARGGVQTDGLNASDNVICYLPPAWVGDHLFSFAQWLVAGFTINCPESASTIAIDLREIGPSYYFAPPRIFEGMLTSVSIRMEDASPLKQWMYAKAMEVARRVGSDILDGKNVGAVDRLKYQLGSLFIYGPLRNALGLRARVPSAPSCFASSAPSASTSSSSTAKPKPVPMSACSATARWNSPAWARPLRASSSRLPTTARCWSRACPCSRSTTSAPTPRPR
jgi:long-chain acyl-CoA synthetase